MQDWVPSRTALRVALRRAEHQVLDRPLVFEDPLAIPILGPDLAAGILPGQQMRRTRLTPSFRSYMAVRSRYAEDQLSDAVARGVRQCVVLGAGLDTLACRNPFANRGLRIFEIDHPATQRWKKELLRAAAIQLAPSSALVPVNFEKDSLVEPLAAAGFNLTEPAFFSWLGVTPYLTEAAFTETLRFVAARGPATGIVFDYSIVRDGLNEKQTQALDALKARVARMGEPLRLFFRPADMQSRLLNLGFATIEDLGHTQVNDRYFAARADGLRVRSNLSRLVSATVNRTP